MKLVLFIITLFSFSLSYSQQDEEYYKTAMEIIKNREFEKAHQYLDSIHNLTNNDVFIYERAVVYYRQKMFREAIEILEKLVVKEDAKMEYYQLLGSCYDFEAEKKKSVNVLSEGLFKFPDKGNLYYELGVTKLGMQERQDAADLWEKGIYVDPLYDRNYYQLVKFYRNTEFKIVALLYGEIFINIAIDDAKKQEVSGIIFDIYKSAFEEYKLSQKLDLSKYSKDFTIEEAVAFPFIYKFQEISNVAIQKIDLTGDITIKMISDFRKEFLSLWLEQKNDIFFSNTVFDYQKTIESINYFEAYNYLLFSAGNIDEIKMYAQTNRQNIIDIVNWQNNNRIEITEDNKYFSQKYRP